MSSIKPVNYLWGENLNWAKANAYHGKNSLVSGLSATTLGCIKTFISSDSLSYKALDLFQSVLLGLRSNQQYSIYSRKDDDDLGFDETHRPHAANIGEITCFIEKNINPIALPLTTILGKSWKEGYHSMAHLANALWWRIRLFSKKIHLTKMTPYLKKLFYINSASERKQLVEDIEHVITPLLGLTGFMFTGLFTPIKSWNKFQGNENKIIDSLSSLGIATQHLIYFFKFTLPQLFHFQDSRKKEPQILFSTGIIANTLNIGMPIIDLCSFENPFLNKIQTLYRELASGFTMIFFSTRRAFLGKDWIRKNN